VSARRRCRPLIRPLAAGEPYPASGPTGPIPRATGVDERARGPRPCHGTRVRSSPRCLTWPTCLIRQNDLPPGTSQDPGEITAITAALNAGTPFRDVQDFAGHADPRTTRRYDLSRHNLDRHATYALASRLGRGTDQPIPPDEPPDP